MSDGSASDYPTIQWIIGAVGAAVLLITTWLVRLGGGREGRAAIDDERRRADRAEDNLKLYEKMDEIGDKIEANLRDVIAAMRRSFESRLTDIEKRLSDIERHRRS